MDVYKQQRDHGQLKTSFLFRDGGLMCCWRNDVRDGTASGKRLGCMRKDNHSGLDSPCFTTPQEDKVLGL